MPFSPRSIGVWRIGQVWTGQVHLSGLHRENPGVYDDDRAVPLMHERAPVLLD
jgi:hypothetical protein